MEIGLSVTCGTGAAPGRWVPLRIPQGLAAARSPSNRTRSSWGRTGLTWLRRLRRSGYAVDPAADAKMRDLVIFREVTQVPVSVTRPGARCPEVLRVDGSHGYSRIQQDRARQDRLGGCRSCESGCPGSLNQRNSLKRYPRSYPVRKRRAGALRNKDQFGEVREEKGMALQTRLLWTIRSRRYWGSETSRLGRKKGYQRRRGGQ